MVEIYGKSDRGNVRENNEDQICYPRPKTTSPTPPAGAGQLLLVADGVGGVQGGEHASRLTMDTVKRAYYYGDHAQDPRWLLRRAIEAANQEVLTYTSAHPALRGAASTVTAAVIKGNQLYVANVGDSRTYVIRADGQSQQISIDHSLTQHKIQQNLLDPSAAKNDIDSHVITRSVGLEPTVEVDLFPASTVQPPYIPLGPGDAVLLCSDGLTDLVSDAEIARIVAANPPQKAVNQLINLAKRNGGHDNISVIVGRLPGPRKAGAIHLPGAIATIAANRRLWVALALLLVISMIGLGVYAAWPVSNLFTNAPFQTAIAEPQPAVTPTAPMLTVAAATPATANRSPATTPTVTRVTAPTPSATPFLTPVSTTIRAPASPQAPTPGPVVTSAPIAQPILMAPAADYAIPSGGETIFEWQWEGKLTANQGFEVIFWPQGKPGNAGGIHDARETMGMTPAPDGIYRLTKKVTNHGPGNYEWTVAVVRPTPYQILVEASPRPIKISSPNSSSDPGSGAAAPR